jgi:anti-anti-sigma factor
VDQQPSPRNSVVTALGSRCVISENWIGRTAVISVAGVIDMLTSPQLDASIDSAMAKKPTAVIVDLTDVDFLASAGMGALVAAHDRAAGHTGFAVVAHGPATSRPLTLVGLADVIGMYPTLDAARAALGE